MLERDTSLDTASYFNPSGRESFEPKRKIGEKCAVVGVTNNLLASKHVTEGLRTLQHRGPESTGISASDGEIIRTRKGKGLVSHVFSKRANIMRLRGTMASGHNRYGTDSRGRSATKHIQPILDEENTIALSHNGNLPDTTRLEAFLDSHGISMKYLNDSGMMHAAITHFVQRGASLEDAVSESIPLFNGAFSLLVMDKNKLIAVRDQRGIRPLSMGKLNGGYAFASETCALKIMEATNHRDVKPGEMVIATKDGEISSTYFTEDAQQKLDIFEFVYFARPDSYLLGQNVYKVRERFGKTLWEESHIEGDIVIPVPSSGIPAAIGYANASGIPYGEGFSKNQYADRIFMDPDAKNRAQATRLKLSVLEENVRGKKLVLIDDSIVRGTTMRTIIQLLRDSGASGVDLGITCPPIKFPDFYGIDTPRQKDLISACLSIEETRLSVGADSLHFLSFEGMIRATELPLEVFSTSCFTGEYPINIGRRESEINR